MKILKLTLLTAVTILFSLKSYSADTLRIMPLGNSITQGGGSTLQDSYRKPLYHMLTDSGIVFDFVGSLNSDNKCNAFTPGFDHDHEGHWAWRADQVLHGYDGGCTGVGKLSDWLQNYTPDMVLLHLGTNDAFQGNSAQSTINELDSIIDVIRDDNPNVVVFLAKLIPTAKSLTDADRIIAINKLIPGLAAKKHTVQSPVVVVDQFSDYDPVLDNRDDVHPNDSGEVKVAKKWFDAINFHVKYGIAQNITFPTRPYRIVGEEFELNATSTSGLPISYRVVSGPAVLNGNNVTILGATGKVVIEAMQEGDADYGPATPVQQTIDVTNPTQGEPFLLTAFAFGTDDYTTKVFNDSSQTYNKVQHEDGLEGPNLDYDSITGFGFSDKNALDQTPNNRDVALCGEELYDQNIATNGTAIVFRADVPNGDYKFVLSMGDAQFIFTNKLSVRDGASGTPISLVDQSTDGLEYAIVKFDDKQPLPCSGATFIYQTESPILNVSSGYIDFIIGGTKSAMVYVELWNLATDIGIVKTAQTITFDTIFDKNYDDADFTISATASSSLPVSFTVISGPASVSGNTVSLTGDNGTVVIQANQLGDTAYKAATPVIRSFEVTGAPVKIDQTVSISPISDKLISDEPFGVSASTTSGLPLAYKVVSGPAYIADSIITLSGTPGSVVIRVIQNGNVTYNADSADVSFLVIDPNAAEDTILLEAEWGTTSDPWLDTAFAGSSNDTGIISFNKDFSNPGDLIEYQFIVTQTDSYNFFVRMNSIGNNDDSFYYKIDGGSYSACNNNGAKSLEWVKFTTETLTPGSHTLVIGSREPAILDKFLITNDDSYTPTGIEGEAIIFKNNDTLLNDLLVDGLTVNGFNATTQTYSIALLAGADSTVSAVANDNKATVKISQAIAIPGEAIVIVVAENGIDSATYTISFTKAVVSTIGSSNIKETLVRPNPVKNTLNVSNANGENYAVISITGSVLDNGTVENTIDMSNYISGMYIVKIGDAYFRVVKE